MQHLTFRSSRIIYYGPHACSNCGVKICKMGTEFGGNAFTYPEGPIYPNTEWYPHVCDPKAVSPRDLIATLRKMHLKAVAENVPSRMVTYGWLVEAPTPSGYRPLTKEEVAEITAPEAAAPR